MSDSSGKTVPMKIIAHIESLFPEKFGIPRQAGIVDTPARIVFEPQYRVAEAVRGIEGFDYLWLVWLFSEAQREDWSPTVRPPRLGGNERVGVFASRSPFRPNPVGLSSVRLTGVEMTTDSGPVLHVAGADLMDGTPIPRRVRAGGQSALSYHHPAADGAFPSRPAHAPGRDHGAAGGGGTAFGC